MYILLLPLVINIGNLFSVCFLHLHGRIERFNRPIRNWNGELPQLLMNCVPWFLYPNMHRAHYHHGTRSFPFPVFDISRENVVYGRRLWKNVNTVTLIAFYEDLIKGYKDGLLISKNSGNRARNRRMYVLATVHIRKLNRNVGACSNHFIYSDF